MSVTLYDNALLDKFTNPETGVFENTVLSPPDEAFMRCAELPANGGQVKLPLISIYREGYTINLENWNYRRFRIGQKQSYPDPNTKTEVTMVRTLPIKIEYQIDVWATSKTQVDAIVRELVFWLLDSPYVKIEVPNSDYRPEVSFKIEDIVDNSEIMSFEERGRFYRMTIPIVFEEAHLFCFNNLKTVLEVPVELSIDE